MQGPAKTMSQLLPTDYVSKLKDYLDRFNQLKKGYDECKQHLQQRRKEVEDACRYCSVPQNFTDQLTRQFDLIALRVADRSLALQSLDRKIIELKDLQTIFNPKDGKLCSRRCIQRVDADGKLHNDHLTKFLDIYISGENQLEELGKQERFQREFRADLQALSQKSQEVLGKLKVLQTDENQLFGQLLNSFGMNTNINSSMPDHRPLNIKIKPGNNLSPVYQPPPPSQQEREAQAYLAKGISIKAPPSLINRSQQGMN